MAPTTRTLAFLVAAVPGALGHGYLKIPAARQVVLQNGLNINGGSPLDIGDGNMMNMNGGQGAFMTPCAQGHTLGCPGATYDLDDKQCKTCVDKLLNNTNVIECKAAWCEYGGVQNEALWPNPRMGVCGDNALRNGFSFNHTNNAALCNGDDCLKQALDNTKWDDTNTFFRGNAANGTQTIDVYMTITAYHFGWAEFRLCRNAIVDGAYNTSQNTFESAQACFNADVLEFDAEDAKNRYGADKMDGGGGFQCPVTDGCNPKDPTDYQALSPHVKCQGTPNKDSGKWNPFGKFQLPQLYSPQGTCCLGGGDNTGSTGCGGFKEDGSQIRPTRFVFPSMDAAKGKKTTDCPKGAVSCLKGGGYWVKLKLPKIADTECTETAPCTLQWLFMTGNSADAYPEAFRNCADFTLGPKHNPEPAPPVPPAGPSPSPGASPSPSPTPSPSSSCTPNKITIGPAWCGQYNNDKAKCTTDFPYCPTKAAGPCCDTTPNDCCTWNPPTSEPETTTTTTKGKKSLDERLRKMKAHAHALQSA